jgi:hypothetical protein
MTSVHESERVILGRKVGPTGSIIMSCMARLYLASPNPHINHGDDDYEIDPILLQFPRLSAHEWTYTHIVGFLVLMVDHKMDTFLIRLYEYKTYHLRFEFEIYYDMEYKLLDPQFHAFEMENCVAGLSFSVKSEGVQFHSKISALKPTSKDSAATILKKMRSSLHPSPASTLRRAHHSQSADAAYGSPQDSIGGSSDSTDSNTSVATTPEHQQMLKEYEEALKKYEQDLARYQAEQEALAKYEEEKRLYEEKCKIYMSSKEKKKKVHKDVIMGNVEQKQEEKQTLPAY